MTLFKSFIKPVFSGYRSLFSGLFRLGAALLIVALLAGAIALPLWYVSINHPALYTRLLLGGGILWMVTGIFIRHKTPTVKEGTSRKPSNRRKRVLHILFRVFQVLAILLLAQIATAAAAAGNLLVGIGTAVLALLLLGFFVHSLTDRK